ARAGSGRDLRPSGRGVDGARSDLGRRESSERQGERQGAQGDVSAALAAIAASAQSIPTVAAIERVGPARDDHPRADGRTAAVLSDDRRDGRRAPSDVGRRGLPGSSGGGGGGGG